MKTKILKPLFTAVASAISLFSAGQFCDANGHVIIYSNYDGGTININVDQDIPNLRIGICTYEATIINITGTYASNVTEVHYAGFDSYNTHCGADIPGTEINAPVGTVVSSSDNPPATFIDPDGSNNIICAYSCTDGNQGGCNTAIQIVDYFEDFFNAQLLYYYTQYGCWPSGSMNVSDGGNCCPGNSPNAPVASFEISDDEPCAGACVDFLDTSTNTPTGWNWTFEGAEVATSAVQDPSGICFENPGSYQVSLNAYNIFGSSAAIATIDVQQCEIYGCTYPQALNYNPDATIDDQSCQFNCSDDCPGDFTQDGIISVSDLLEFISVYGTLCD